MSSIFLYLLLLIVGGFLSYRGVVPRKLFDKLEHIQLICLFILLFAMGLRIGMDDRVINAFLKLGIHATLFALVSIFFSILTVWLFRKTLLKLLTKKEVQS
ncbi:DUF340 domain-containing protein [Fusibacter ferrireducens]|uniref:DUF340 domain-containing protein n=1 Tax=Fusibacter ferrireducens TaxID=2785058 RepID=A0ABR9ZR99_9FIRM|nr:DUF340 domain-containing protein [Fusibacter ferrireducens]MBF4692977.1 DUF340 domain-containing protein [Fusibacter ferrireducens]